ncbi:MAG: hypothetical protein K8I30_19140 [Anaerolineae bacterium]|nr:hypothetical protein [Anaerolineae bacterium]
MRKAFLLLVLVLMFTISGGLAAAQEVPPTFCGTLADADCAILTDSAAAMRDLQSAAFNFQLDLGISNIPEGKPADLRVRLTGDGAYAIDSEVLGTFMFAPSEMMQNMDKLPEMMEDMIKAISADATLVLYLPQNIPNMDQPLPEKVGLSIRLVDGVGYANLDKLAELDTSSDLPKGWVGLDLATFLREAIEAQASGMGSMGAVPGMGTMNMDMMGAFSDPEFMNAFMTITRAADTMVEGQNAAVFNQSIDLGALYASDEFETMMREQLDTMAGSSGMSKSDLDSIMGMYSTMFEGFVINVSQTIGLDDHYIHQTTAALDWALDFGSMMGSMGAGSAAARMEPINISFAFVGNLSQFNSAPTITAPEDAEMIPLNSLLGRGSF